MDRPTASITHDQWTRVVALLPASSASSGDRGGAPLLSPNLQAEFARRDWFAIEHTDPYLALAELCLRERAQAARAAWGLQRMERIALVILQPESRPPTLVADLARAVQHCLSGGAVYVAQGDHIEMMIADGVPSTSGDGAPGASAQAAGGAAMTDSTVVRNPQSRRGVDAVGEPRVTRDEIDMLLHEQDDESAPTGKDMPANIRIGEDRS